MLDHGTYVDVEEQLRQQFCQLWCAVIMRDEATQVGRAGSGPGGNRRQRAGGGPFAAT